MKTFLEIGVADFDTLIPLAKEGWRGIICEPHPVHVERLKKECEGLLVEIIPNAIGAGDDLEFLSPSRQWIEEIDAGNWGEQARWIKGISSFAREGLVTALENQVSSNNLNPDLYLDRTTIPTVLLDDVLKDYTHIDFFKCDTEGHELHILENYSWRIKPTFIKIEHRRMDGQWDRVTEPLRDLLLSKGYHLWQEHDDFYGVLKD